MAATVINSAEGVNRYRNKIAQSIENLNNSLTKTETSINEVSQSWKDPNFQKFQTNFDNEKVMIRSLCQVLTNYHENILYQLEQKLREYEENTRMSIS